MRSPDCNPDISFLWPVRPIAKLFCDAYQLSPHSKLGAIGLFAINCGLLFFSYVLSHDLSNFTQDALYRLIGEQLPKQVVLLIAGWLAQLLITNSTFFLVRFVLAKLFYAIYELGRDVVFAILVLPLVIGLAWLGIAYFAHQLPDTFIQDHKLFVLGLLINWIVTSWYWGRYIYRSKERKHVFDHDVGAALVQLTS